MVSLITIRTPLTVKSNNEIKFPCIWCVLISNCGIYFGIWKCRLLSMYHVMVYPIFETSHRIPSNTRELNFIPPPSITPMSFQKVCCTKFLSEKKSFFCCWKKFFFCENFYSNFSYCFPKEKFFTFLSKNNNFSEKKNITSSNIFRNFGKFFAEKYYGGGINFNYLVDILLLCLVEIYDAFYCNAHIHRYAKWMVNDFSIPDSENFELWDIAWRKLFQKVNFELCTQDDLNSTWRTDGLRSKRTCCITGKIYIYCKCENIQKLLTILSDYRWLKLRLYCISWNSANT